MPICRISEGAAFGEAERARGCGAITVSAIVCKGGGDQEKGERQRGGQLLFLLLLFLLQVEEEVSIPWISSSPEELGRGLIVLADSGWTRIKFGVVGRLPAGAHVGSPILAAQRGWPLQEATDWSGFRPSGVC